VFAATGHPGATLVRVPRHGPGTGRRPSASIRARLPLPLPWPADAVVLFDGKDLSQWLPSSAWWRTSASYAKAT